MEHLKNNYYDKKVQGKLVNRMLLNTDEQHNVYIMMSATPKLIKQLNKAKKDIGDDLTYDNLNLFQFEHNGIIFSAANVILYDGIDLHKLECVEVYEKILYKPSTRFIPSNYDYKTHTHGLLFEAVNDIKTIVRYAHGCLNKPEQIVLIRMRKDKYNKQAIKSLELNVQAS